MHSPLPLRLGHAPNSHSRLSCVNTPAHVFIVEFCAAPQVTLQPVTRLCHGPYRMRR